MSDCNLRGRVRVSLSAGRGFTTGQGFTTGSDGRRVAEMLQFLPNSKNF